MAFLIPTNAVQIARFANGLYGLQLGFASTNGIVSDVASGGLLPTFNNYYTLSFGSQATASVAQQILTNLGIVASPTGLSATAVSAALAYVTGQLNAAAPNARGAAVKAVFDLWSSISADPVNGPIYGAVATAWNTTISGAVQYAGAVNPDISVAAAVAVNAANALIGKTFTLTTGVDSFTGTSANDTFTAASGNFTALDSLDGVGGNDVLNIAQTTTAFVQPTGITVKNIPSVNASFAAGGTIDVSAGSGFTGVTALTVTSTGGTLTVTGAGTTALTLTDSLPGANAVSVNGGSSVNVTTSAAVNGATITIGATTAPTGAVTVANGTVFPAFTSTNTSAANAQAAAIAAGAIQGAVTVTGGTTIAITQTTTTATTAQTTDGTNIYAIASGNTTVTGGTTTTSVSITNPAPVLGVVTITSPTADNTRLANAGILGVVPGTVKVTDAVSTSTTAAGTIASVTLNGYSGTANTIASNALNTLTLSNAATSTNNGTAATLAISNALATGFPTTLTINQGLGSSGAITDSSNKFTTLNVVTTAATGTLAGFTDSSLRTLAVSGTGTLTVSSGSSLDSTLTAFSITGAGSLVMDLSGDTGISAIVMGNTGSGNRITLNPTIQSYTGSTNSDRVTITSYPSKIINGNGGTDTIVLNLAGSNFTTANAATTATNLVGFSVLGNGTSSTGTFNMATLPSSINSINLLAAVPAAGVSYTNVVPGTPLTIAAAPTGNITYTTSDFNGPANSLNVTLAPASATAAQGGATIGYTIPALILNDSVGGGLGTLNLAGTATASGGAFTTTLLTDVGLTTLNITGSAMQNITAINANTSTATRLQSTSLVISDNDTSTSIASPANVSTIGTLFVNTLASLSYSGSKAFQITLIDGDTASGINLTNANTGTTGVLTIGAATLAAGSTTNGISDSSLTSLRLSGSVQAAVITANTANVTVSGSTDNSAVNFTHNSSTGTGDTITLGNGANVIVESGAGTVQTSANADTITLGSGANNVTAGLGADTVTFAAHGSSVTINFSTTTTFTATSATDNDTGYVNGGSVGTISANTFGTFTGFTSNSISTSAFDVYIGMRTGDKIQFTSTAGGTAYSAAASGLTDAASTTNALKTSGTLLTNLTGLTQAVLNGTVASGTGNIDNGAIFVRGVYNALTQTFNGSSTGADTLMVFDANPTATVEVNEGIILVGYVPGSVAGISGTTAGLITLG